MTYALQILSVALVLLPLLSQAQSGTAGAVGLEIPAPAPPAQRHFLTGAYVVGNYTPLATASGYGYAVQPYLRYVLGTAGHARPFVQYSFAPYRLQAYGAGRLYAADGAGLSANPVFAPLPLRSTSYNGYGSGLGQLSLGVPVRVGGSPVMLHVAGNVLSGLLR